MRYVVHAALLALAVGPAAAQAQSSLDEPSLDTVASANEASGGLRRGSFILAPIPLRNPTVGTGLALGAGYIFTIDPGSNPSFVGIGGFKTDNGSVGYAVGANLAFGDGSWQVRGAVGEVDLAYDLFVLGVPFPIEQTGTLARLGTSYGVTDAASVGLDLGYIESEIGAGGDRLPDSIAPDFGISTVTADMVLSYDTRNDTIYPTSGVNASLRAGWGTVVEGPARDFTRALGKLDFYLPVLGTGVVAGQFTACDVSKDTPFFLACSLGGSDAFRGYPSTQNIADSLASLQIAYRGRLGGRFGYAIFAGTGRVAEDFSNLGDAEDLTAGGVGVRFRVSRKFPVDFSVDVAVNRDDETTTYIYVGQRF